MSIMTPPEICELKSMEGDVSGLFEIANTEGSTGRALPLPTRSPVRGSLYTDLERPHTPGEGLPVLELLHPNTGFGNVALAQYSSWFRTRPAVWALVPNTSWAWEALVQCHEVCNREQGKGVGN